MTLPMNNVLFERHSVTSRLMNRRLTTFSARFTLFALFKKLLLMRPTQKQESTFLLLYIIERL